MPCSTHRSHVATAPKPSVWQSAADDLDQRKEATSTRLEHEEVVTSGGRGLLLVRA
jgi:hypothetical protein